MANIQTSMLKTALGLSDAEILSIANASGVTNEDHREAISMKFTTAEWDNNKSIREAVAYLGFDAKKIVEQFFKKADSNKIGPEDRPINHGEFELYEKNDAKTDLMFFFKIFLERGNNLHKALMRCDDKMGLVLRRKASAYGITTESTQNKTILGTKHLTLARLAQAFAHCTALLIVKDKVPSKLTSRLFPNVPLLMLHTVFPALIPSDLDGVTDQLREIAILINVEMTMLLADAKSKRKLALQGLDDLCDSSKMYVEAAMNGSAIPSQSRIMILVKAGILMVSGTVILTTEVQAAVQIVRGLLGLLHGMSELRLHLRLHHPCRWNRCSTSRLLSLGHCPTYP